MWDSDHAAQAAGAQIVESGPGHALVRLTVRKDMVNGHAIAHGGHLFMLADIAFGYACNGYGPAAVARSGTSSSSPRPTRATCSRPSRPSAPATAATGSTT